MEMVSKAHSVCPHFCPCMALIHAISPCRQAHKHFVFARCRGIRRIRPKMCPSACEQGSQRLASFLSVHGFDPRNSPCRQARDRAAFARCRGIRRIRPKMCPSACEQGSQRLSPFLSVHGSLLTRKMRRRKDLCRRRKKEKENKKKVRHGGLEPPTT